VKKGVKSMYTVYKTNVGRLFVFKYRSRGNFVKVIGGNVTKGYTGCVGFLAWCFSKGKVVTYTRVTVGGSWNYKINMCAAAIR